MRSLFGIFLCTVSLIGPTLAATVLMNASIGRGCYFATLQPAGAGNDRKGLAACDEAVAATETDQDSHVAALVNRSDIRLRMMDFQAAATDAQQAIALDPNQPVAHLNLGASMIGLKRYNDAIPSLEKAIALNVQPLQLAYFDRALAEEALGDLAGAYQDYKKALDFDPQFQLAATELARFKVKAN